MVKKSIFENFHGIKVGEYYNMITTFHKCRNSINSMRKLWLVALYKGYSALAVERILLEAGFPEGAFQTLLIGADRVSDLINDKRVKAATLTGSEPAGMLRVLSHRLFGAPA